MEKVSKSVFMLAALAIALAVPQFLLGLVAGVLGDRLSRKATMIVVDLLRALVILGALAVRDGGDLPILLLVVAFLGSIGSFSGPARNASIPISSKKSCF